MAKTLVVLNPLAGHGAALKVFPQVEEQLRAAGIEVECRVLRSEADWVTKGHILRVTERRPFIQLKLALAADGSVPRGVRPAMAVSRIRRGGRGRRGGRLRC